MRDNILGRKEGRVNMRQARRNETRMLEACERSILEFPLDIDEREVAKQLKREGWYAWASNHYGIVSMGERRPPGKTRLPLSIRGQQKACFPQWVAGRRLFICRKGNDSRTACRAKGPHGYAGAKARSSPASGS